MNSPESTICLYLLGRFEIVREGRKLRADEWSRRKAAALIKYLAIQKRLVKDQAIDLFWPDSDLDSGSNNLYRTLHELRQTLSESLGDDTAEQLFRFEDGILSLNESVWIDVTEFERLSSAKTKSQNERIASLEDAIALYQGDLLPDANIAMPAWRSRLFIAMPTNMTESFPFSHPCSRMIKQMSQSTVN